MTARRYECALDAGRSRVTRRTSETFGPTFTVQGYGMDKYRGDLLRLYVSPDGTYQLHARDADGWHMVLVAEGSLPE